MFPIIAIVSAISAAVSVYKGASWVADKVGGTPGAASAAGKTAAAGKTDTPSPFEAALAAQAAGQTMPGTANPGTATGLPPSLMLASNGTNYDQLARMQAGIAAYGHTGAPHAAQAWPTKPNADDGPALGMLDGSARMAA